MRLLTLVLLSIMCVANVQAQSDAPNVSISSMRLIKGAVEFHWRIQNHSANEVVIYSTFLNGPAAGHQVDPGGETEIYTSLMKALDIDVYGYPQAKFISLKPGQTTEGDFTDHFRNKRWIKPGSIVVFNVSYGTDLDGVQAALQHQFTSPAGGHAANPIVRWQKIARSNGLTAP